MGVLAKNVVLLLTLSCLARVTRSIHQSPWLHYGCSADGELSIVNPDPDTLHYVFASVRSTVCESAMTEDNKMFTVKGCDTQKNVKIILSKSSLANLLAGGKSSEVYEATCNLNIAFYRVASFNFQTQGTFQSTDPNAEAPEDLTVDYRMMDLRGADNFNAFTVGYPITLQLLGPAGTSIRPKSCVAIAGEMETNATVPLHLIQDGCSMKPKLIFDFTEDWFDFFDRGVPGFDMSLIIDELTGEFMQRGGDPSEQHPSLMTHLFSFRFFGQKVVTVKCDVDICPFDDPACDIECPEEDSSRKKRAIPDDQNEADQNEAVQRKDFAEDDEDLSALIDFVVDNFPAWKRKNLSVAKRLTAVAAREVVEVDQDDDDDDDADDDDGADQEAESGDRSDIPTKVLQNVRMSYDDLIAFMQVVAKKQATAGQQSPRDIRRLATHAWRKMEQRVRRSDN